MKKRGIGIACMFYPIGFTSYPNPGSAFVKINQDGTVIVYTGATDIGQGSTTVLAQIAAEVLGIDYEKVSLVVGDTKLTPFDLGTVASRVTFIVGNAVKRAAENAKRILLEVAAEELQVSADGLDVENGEIYIKGFPEKRISISQTAATAILMKGRPPIGCGYYNPVTTFIDPERGHGKPYGAYVFATQIADVEVDTETGEIDVLRIIAVHDCGKAINPLLVEGQVEGGVGMGVGYGIMEEMVLENGEVKNPQFTDYILPTALDVPDIKVEIIERPEPEGPFGAKGIGEPSLLPTAPAIINAIYDAVGVKIRDLPATPEKVIRALKEKEKNASLKR